MHHKLAVALATACLLGFVLVAHAEDNAWALAIDGEINSGTVTYLRRGIQEATDAGASCVVVTLATPGGSLDAAVAARRIVLDATVPTIAHVSREAFSAGALIAIACETILFSPGGVMGAATPVTILGGKLREAPEKIISATGKLFRATAELRGRPPEIAEAMVNSDVSIPELVEAEKLLTLTSREAAVWGYSDGEVQSIESWLADNGYGNVVSYEIRWIDELVDTLTSPVAVALLITVGLLGLIVEMLMPGFGVPGLIGIACLGTFFWTHFLVGLAGWESIAFLLGGMVAVALEVFAFTAVDFGLSGLLGLVLIGLGFYTAQLGPFAGREHAVQAIAIVSAGLIASITVAIVLLTKLPRTRLRLGGMILSTAITGSSHQAAHQADTAPSAWIGREGIAATDLRPVGAATFGTERVDVVCEEGHLAKGTRIVVVKDDVYRKVVRRKEEEGER